MKQVFGFAAIAILVCAARPATAGGIIVDNTGDASGGGQPTTSTLSIGMGFTMGGQSEPLGTIAAAVTPGAHLALYTEGTIHVVPISLITTLTDTGTHNALGDEIYTPASPVTLDAGQQYAVVMSGSGFSWSTTNGAATNLLGVMDLDFNGNEGSGWFEISSGARLQMQVDVLSAVPEPSTIVMSMPAIAICGATGLYRRRRRAA